MKKYLVFIAVAVWLCACSDYQKLLKSSDADLKYEKAIEYFDKGDYMRAQTLFDEVTTYYRGTERSETLLNYIARSYMGQKDYYSATEYYKAYVRTYPKGQYAEESKFMIGYCYYNRSRREVQRKKDFLFLRLLGRLLGRREAVD